MWNRNVGGGDADIRIGVYMWVVNVVFVLLGAKAALPPRTCFLQRVALVRMNVC
jgi:hypothetical protein